MHKNLCYFSYNPLSVSSLKNSWESWVCPHQQSTFWKSICLAHLHTIGHRLDLVTKSFDIQVL